jgi:hypothetical protein
MTRLSASTATRVDRRTGVQVVRDHHHGQAQLGMQLAQQRAELVGAVGVQAGGGLVQQQQRRVHDERARQRHALDHAARQVGRHARGVLGLEAHHLQLDHARRAPHRRQRAQLAQGKAMLSSTLKAENSAPCWNSMPTRRRRLAAQSRPGGPAP